MKSVFTLFLTLSVFAANSQTVNSTRTSVANGNASSPFTWDCTCIPIPGDDIIINTNVTLDVDWGYTSGSLTINSGKTFIGNSSSRILAVGGGSFTNNGTVDIAYIYHSGGAFTNNGNLTVSQSFANNTGVTTTNNNQFIVSDTLYINATLHNDHTVSAYATANAGTFHNNGGFTTGDLLNTGTIMNSGFPGMVINNDLYSSGTITNGTYIHVLRDLWNSETFTNNDYIVIDRTLYTGDSVQFTATFTNNGLISIAQDMYSNQTVTGTGDFCIAGTTANSGSITGTLDICDLSGGSIDLNVGTVAGTVTFCSSSCAVGVDEKEEVASVSVYPNPFTNKLKLKVEGFDNAQFVLQNLLGQKLIDKTIHSNTEISVIDLENGLYFYSFIVNEKVVSSGKLLKE